MYSVGDKVRIIDAMNPDYIGRVATITKVSNYTNSPISYKLSVGGGDWLHSMLEKVGKDAWILRLKDESKEEGMTGEYYLDDEGEELDWLTQDLNKATVFDDKERAIYNFKLYEKAFVEKFGADAICNFGYTNIMKHFEFVEVEIIKK